MVVLRKGRVVERGRSVEVLAGPREEYTAALIEAVPGRGLQEREVSDGSAS